MLCEQPSPVPQKPPLRPILIFLPGEFLDVHSQQGQQSFPYPLSLKLLGPLCCSPLPNSKVFLCPSPHIITLAIHKVWDLWLLNDLWGKKEDWLATHTKNIQVIFISPSLGSIRLTWNVHPTAALRPRGNTCILLHCFSLRQPPPPPKEWCFLKVLLQGSVLSTDNTIK